MKRKMEITIEQAKKIRRILANESFLFTAHRLRKIGALRLISYNLNEMYGIGQNESGYWVRKYVFHPESRKLTAHYVGPRNTSKTTKRKWDHTFDSLEEALGYFTGYLYRKSAKNI